MQERCRLISESQWREYKKLKELYEQSFIVVKETGKIEEIQFGSVEVQVVDNTQEYQELVTKCHRLEEQLKEANELLWKIQDCREDREHFSELAYNHLEKWGVK